MWRLWASGIVCQDKKMRIFPGGRSKLSWLIRHRFVSSPKLPSLPSLHPQTQTRADARAKYSYLSGNLPLFLTFCPTTLRDAERGREAEMMGREEGGACVPPRKTDSNKSPVKIRVSPRAARAVQQNMVLLAWQMTVELPASESTLLKRKVSSHPTYLPRARNARYLCH